MYLRGLNQLKFIKKSEVNAQIFCFLFKCTVVLTVLIFYQQFNAQITSKSTPSPGFLSKTCGYMLIELEIQISFPKITSLEVVGPEIQLFAFEINTCLTGTTNN